MTDSTTLRFVLRGVSVMVGPVPCDDELTTLAKKVIVKNGVSTKEEIDSLPPPRLFCSGKILPAKAIAGSVPKDSKIMIHPADTQVGLRGDTQQQQFQGLLTMLRFRALAAWEVVEESRKQWSSFLSGFCGSMFSTSR